jgi:hypothetical protein
VRVYLAGPMTGYPSFNFPAFDALARDLRLVVAAPGVKAYDVVTPSEMEERDYAMASPDGAPDQKWGHYLSRDLRIIADDGIEGIVVLPDWEKSRGARVETFIAFVLGLPIFKPHYDYQGRVFLVQETMQALIKGWIGGLFRQAVDQFLREGDC